MFKKVSGRRYFNLVKFIIKMPPPLAMVEFVKNIAETGIDNGIIADCYVSTDSGEIEAILESLKLISRLGNSEPNPVRGFDWIDSVYSTADSRFFVYCEDIKLQEDMDLRKRLGENGFPSMSKFRVESRNGAKKEEFLVSVLRELEKERQNFALVSETNRAYVKMSKFYR